MVISFGYALSFEYAVFAFGYSIFIRVWLFHLSMLFTFRYALCVWIHSLYLGIVFAFEYIHFISLELNRRTYY